MEKIHQKDLSGKLLQVWNERNASATPEAPAKRMIVAIAGAPGSGKSTLAQFLCNELNTVISNSGATAAETVVLPMDGYHFDNDIIEAVGLLARKGSPETFDVTGFTNVIQRIRQLPYSPANKADESDRISGIAVPVFDRQLDLARAGAELIKPEHAIVLVEGNYLLLRQSPWAQLRPLFDLSIFLEVPMKVLEKRLIKRWLEHDHTEDEARARAQSNDLPNARTVIEYSAVADFVLSY